MIYYIFLAIILVSFLACVIVTICDNSESNRERKEKVDDSNFKSRRSLYNDYLNRVKVNYNYYSYSNKVRTETMPIVEEETEEIIDTYVEPVITSVTDYVEEEDNNDFIKTLEVLGLDYPGDAVVEEIDDGMPTMLVPVLYINK